MIIGSIAGSISVLHSPSSSNPLVGASAAVAVAVLRPSRASDPRHAFRTFRIFHGTTVDIARSWGGGGVGIV